MRGLPHVSAARAGAVDAGSPPQDGGRSDGVSPRGLGRHFRRRQLRTRGLVGAQSRSGSSPFIGMQANLPTKKVLL